MARPTNTGIELRLENETIGQLPFGAGSVSDRSLSRGEQAVAAWQRLEIKGIKIRSRALMTTLFARLFLGDLFIHGIGGGFDPLDPVVLRQHLQYIKDRESELWVDTFGNVSRL